MSKIIITRRIPLSGLKILKDHPSIHIVEHWDEPQTKMPRERLESIISEHPDVEGILTMITDSMDANLIKMASNLRCVSTLSVGYNHIDLESCRQRDPPIRIGYTPNVLTAATAETAVGLVVAVCRRFFESNRAILTGEWGSWAPEWLLGKEVCHSTVGIVGLGRIGQQFARIMAAGFGCDVIYTSRTRKTAFEDALKQLLPESGESGAFDGIPTTGGSISFVETLDEVLERSDIVVPHCALTDSTRHLFDAGAFEKMKPSAIFINTTRGDVVDQNALYEALTTGKIRAAGLDVVCPEPLPRTHRLLSLDNCFILPHIGSATEETRQKMSQIAAQNLIGALVEGEEMAYEVRP